MTLPSTQPSLFSVLKKAQPRWGTLDVCKVVEKLQKANVTDLEALGYAIMDGSLNAQLAKNGERRLKASTLAQLKIEVRGPYRASQLARDPMLAYDVSVGAIAIMSPPSLCMPRSSSKHSSANAGHEFRYSLDQVPRATRELQSGSSLQPARSATSLRQAGESIFTNDRCLVNGPGLTSSGKPLHTSLSEPSLAFKLRIDETSLGGASVSSPCSSNARLLKLASKGSFPKSRSGALNLPEVPGGMRHDDDALQGLLSAAKARIKRGYIKPFGEGNTAAQSPANSSQQGDPLQASRNQLASSVQLSSAQQMPQPGWDERGAMGATGLTMSDTHLSPFNGLANRGMYGSSREGGSVPWSSGSAHTIERLDGYTSTNTAVSWRPCAEDALVQKMWKHENEMLNLDPEFFEELTAGGGMLPADCVCADSIYSSREEPTAGGGVLPATCVRADSIYSSQEGYSSDEVGPSTDGPFSPGSTRRSFFSQRSRQISQPSDATRSRQISQPSNATPFQSQRLSESVPRKQSKEAKGISRQVSVQDGSEPVAATAANNEVRLRGSLARRAPAAESNNARSDALANHRRREGEPTAAEVARESRRRSWMSAYNGGDHQGSRISHGSAMGVSGHTAANSSTNMTGGTSISWKS